MRVSDSNTDELKTRIGNKSLSCSRMDRRFCVAVEVQSLHDKENSDFWIFQDQKGPLWWISPATMISSWESQQTARCSNEESSRTGSQTVSIFVQKIGVKPKRGSGCTLLISASFEKDSFEKIQLHCKFYNQLNWIASLPWAYLQLIAHSISILLEFY